MLAVACRLLYKRATTSGSFFIRQKIFCFGTVGGMVFRDRMLAFSTDWVRSLAGYGLGRGFLRFRIRGYQGNWGFRSC